MNLSDRIIRESPEQPPSSSSSSSKPPEGAQTPLTGDTTIDISSFNLTFYGQQYSTLYINTTGNFTVCFNGYYGTMEGLDCIIGETQTGTNPSYTVYGYSSGTESYLKSSLPSVTNRMTGTLVINDLLYPDAPANVVNIAIHGFGTETVLQIGDSYPNPPPRVFQTMVNGAMVDTFVGVNLNFDLSGCRQSGVGYKTGDVISVDHDTCTDLVCDDTEVHTRPSNRVRSSTCADVDGGAESCSEHVSQLSLEHTCTVSGPAVIDSDGRVNSVQDRCAHSLMSLPSVPNFHVLANFQERRRKDVSFLDSVTLRLDGSDIHLQQGGRVQLNDTTLTLNSSVQEVHGVELSKDHTGVTAKVSLTDYNTSVFFDGNTAHIRVTKSLQGLCGNSSRPLSDVRLSQDSTSGCDVLHNDSADPAINCSAMTERCNLLNEAPFTACHNHTDPAPYITACTDTLCKYPAVDGLGCQFLEAYAKACSLYSTLEDWRSKAGCCKTCLASPPLGPPVRTGSAALTSSAEKASGEDGCFCRALFASPYRSTGTLGDPTVCERDSASLSLVGCLLEEKGIDYSTLHLNDNSCVGQVDEQTHMVTFDGSDSCGTVVSVNNSQVIYKNTIMTHNHTDVIVRHDQVSIDFSCFYTQPDVRTMSFRIKDSSVIEEITSGAWNYTLTMKAYLDSSRTRLVESSTEVMLNQKIWVELETDGLGDGLVAVVTDSCWATNQKSPNGGLRHDLISSGCANRADQTVEVTGNGQGTSNYFSFNMFQFTGSSADVYLHCRLNLCVTQNNTCAPTCSAAGSRRRRSARSTYVAEAPAFITMAWTN
ncbi:hypothetical protein D5F01_LYC24748 [Larimichthys crocea]|uniref:Alpha-tectorin n=1 Tax=Larimichthys crocea TaxID=215358 RepID=A0A6G0HDS0_LARCR|nr:hypothetical protein D5F01_LYC24748 [Larimichthys crocea]